MLQNLLCFFSGRCMSMDIKKRRLFIGLCCRIFSAAYASKQMPFFICSKPQSAAGLLRLFTNCYTSVTKHGIIMSIRAQKNYNLESAFCTKSSINQMVKCAKKLLNRLTKWVNVLKGCLHQGGKSLGVVRVNAYYVNFQFPHACICPFCPKKLQKTTKHFQCGYKTKTKLKHRTHYVIFQNRHICSDRSAIWLWCIMRLVHFCPIYTACVLRLLVWLIRLFMRSWFVWALSA